MNTRTIAESWAALERLCMPAAATAVQRKEMKRAFYSGFQAALTICQDIGDTDVSEAAAVAVLEGLVAECANFVDEIQAGRA